jgi:Ca2+-transporting ATPase
MDFRIKGGRQDHLEPELMKRLCEGLLLCTGITGGHFLRKTTTEDADTAFFLFGEFLEEGMCVHVVSCHYGVEH